MTQNLNWGNHQLTGKSLIPAVCGVVLLFLMFTFLPTPVLAVSYVDVINGSPDDDFSLNEGKGKLETGLKLKKGDTIKVLTEGSSVELILDGGSVTVTYDSSHDNPCQIGGDCTNIPQKQNGFGNWFFDTLNQLVGHADNMIRNMTRGTNGNDCLQDKTVSFDIPMLEERNNVKLLEGKRQLHLGWRGGYSPYKVSMFRQKQDGSWKEVLHKNNIKNNNKEDCKRALLKETNMEVHEFKKDEYYKVIVTSGNGEQKEGFFKVVSLDKDFHPEMRKEVNANAPFYQVAIWLADYGKGEWKLEAYQKVSRDIDETYSGWLVRLGLAHGIQ